MTSITRLNSIQPNFSQQLDQLLAWEAVSDDQLNTVVKDIIQAIRRDGDAALIDYTARFDGWSPTTADALKIPAERLQLAWERLPVDQRDALQQAADRVRTYAEHQKLASWEYTEADGTLLGQQVTPLDLSLIHI